MSEIEFQSFPKIPRLFRDMTITEKIDGTNAAVGIVYEFGEDVDLASSQHAVIDRGGSEVNGCHNVALVWAQSRKRIITPEADNFGFAKWVWNNAPDLVSTLGVGLHFGEWWGHGIQRGYGLDHKRLSLFNTHRWDWLNNPEARLARGVPGDLWCVPVIAQYTFDTDVIRDSLSVLKDKGSFAAPGYMSPEGIVVFHGASNNIYKATFDMDVHKSELVLAA